MGVPSARAQKTTEHTTDTQAEPLSGALEAPPMADYSSMMTRLGHEPLGPQRTGRPLHRTVKPYGYGKLARRPFNFRLVV